MIAKAIWVLMWAVIGYGVGYLAGMVVGMLIGYWRAEKEVRDDNTLLDLDESTDWNMGPWND